MKVGRRTNTNKNIVPHQSGHLILDRDTAAISFRDFDGNTVCIWRPYEEKYKHYISFFDGLDMVQAGH